MGAGGTQAIEPNQLVQANSEAQLADLDRFDPTISTEVLEPISAPDSQRAAGWLCRGARAISWLVNGVGRWVSKSRAKIIHFFKPSVAHILVALWWPLRRSGRPHGLPGGLILSLTSHPKRFPTLHLTLRCLLSQTIVPDRVILWIADEDAALLPQPVTDLKPHGLEIRFCSDIRSYKKIVPALRAFPTAYIVTADDDVYYSARWLEQLVDRAGERTVVCHRGHSVAFDDAGRIEPYSKWSFNVAGTTGVLFPTGVGGVLYGPQSLPPETVDEDTFTNLCPDADDIWLFWMGHRAGSTYVRAQHNWTELPWKGSQKSSLYSINVGAGRNDEQINKMASHFGLPAGVPSSKTP